MLRNFLKIKKQPQGQGLLEALIAIGIILIGLGAILTFTLKNIAAATDSAQRVVAANLAREAIDVVRGIRDSNWLAASNSDPNRQWDHDFSDVNEVKEANLVPPGNGYGAALIFNLPADPNPAYWSVDFKDSRDVDNNYYNMYRHPQNYDWQQYPGGAPAPYISTGYNRVVLLDPICDTAGTITVADRLAACPTGSKVGVRVTAEVSWQSSGFFGGNQKRGLKIIEYIYNWR